MRPGGDKLDEHERLVRLMAMMATLDNEPSTEAIQTKLAQKKWFEQAYSLPIYEGYETKQDWQDAYYIYERTDHTWRKNRSIYKNTMEQRNGLLDTFYQTVNRQEEASFEHDFPVVIDIMDTLREARMAEGSQRKNDFIPKSFNPFSEELERFDGLFRVSLAHYADVYRL